MAERERAVRKKKSRKPLLIVFLILLLAIGGGAFAFLKVHFDRQTYFRKTTINGYDMSDKTPEEALEILSSNYSASTVVINENGEPSIQGPIADFGYQINRDLLLQDLQKARTVQKADIKTLLTSFIGGSRLTIPMSDFFSFDAEAFRAKVNAASLVKPRIASADAQMIYQEAEKQYVIVPEVYGNEFRDEDLQNLVQQTVSDFTTSGQIGQVTVDIPTEFYFKPTVTADNPDLVTRCNVNNAFCKAEIRYLFGSQSEVLDWNTIQTWISIQDGQGVINEEAVRNHVSDLESRYDTRYIDRHFTTSYGTEVVIPGDWNEYGYTINREGEFNQLMADIRANAPTEREPVYFSTSLDGFETPVYYRREGRDDLAGTYVEVNITAQHLWFYKNGSLVIDTDFVSGTVSNGSETQTGAFPLAFKESPSVLSSASNGYEIQVQYWMPFYEGQGLHDASWRSSFGGSIYQYSGSHGCVNLPSYAAAVIYENIDPGTAILVFKTS